MSKRIAAKYKIDRRLGVNLWGRPKSPFNARETRPGQHGARRRKVSDFGAQLMAKQKLKGYYGNISEKQFRRYYKEAVRPEMPNPDGSSSVEVQEKYAQWEQEYLEVKNKATLIVAKQRHGSTGNVPLHFQSDITKFTSPNMRDYSSWGIDE